MNKKDFKALIFAVLVLLPLIGFAQPGDPNGGNKPVPLTGVELLILGGGLFGAKKIYDKRKKLQ